MSTEHLSCARPAHGTKPIMEKKCGSHRQGSCILVEKTKGESTDRKLNNYNL